MPLLIFRRSLPNAGRHLLRCACLILCFCFASRLLSQDLILSTSANTISLSKIRSCKTNDCIENAIDIVSDALHSNYHSIGEIIAERNGLQEKIYRYNGEVEVFQKAVDSLSGVYIAYQKKQEEYKSDQDNFNDKNRFATTAAMTNASMLQPPRAASRAVQPSTMGNVVNNTAKSQKDADDKSLKERNRNLNMENQRIQAMKGTLEKQRLQLVAEGNFLNEHLKSNTDNLNQAYAHLNEVIQFGNRANLVLSEQPAKQTIDGNLIKQCSTLRDLLAVKLQEANAILVNIVKSK